MSAAGKGPWWASLSGDALDDAPRKHDLPPRDDGEADDDYRDRLALAMPRPVGVRGLADRFAIDPRRTVMHLNDDERAAVLGWIARECQRYRERWPGVRRDAAGYIAAKLGGPFETVPSLAADLVRAATEERES